MTERDWLTSVDPVAMLNWLRPIDQTNRISDRKMRMFALDCQVSYGAYSNLADDWETHGLPGVSDEEWAVRWASDAFLILAPRIRANILRDIVGNPWRPVTLPPGPAIRRDCAACDATGVLLGPDWCFYCEGRGWRMSEATPPPWLTPDVLSIATACYEEQKWPCLCCGGGGRWGVIGGGSSEPCHSCKGAGFTDDGTLDPARLAVLSDALEEAGCDDVSILDHLRSTSPHYRGCWAVDLILGKV